MVATAVTGVEEWRSGTYRRTLRLTHGHGVAELRPTGELFIDFRLILSDLRELTTAINRCRRLLDPALEPLVRKTPGRRVPHTVDGAEFAIRAVLAGEGWGRVSAAAARTRAARLVAAHGTPVTDPGRGLTHLFPAPAELAGLAPATVVRPQQRRDALTALVAALAAGSVDLGTGSDWQQARAQLAAIPGVGAGTVEAIAMRALGDPDAFTATDPGVVLAATGLGLPATPAALGLRSAAWRPWRAYAVQHLRAAGDHAIDRLPATDVTTAVGPTTPTVSVS